MKNKPSYHLPYREQAILRFRLLFPVFGIVALWYVSGCTVSEQNIPVVDLFAQANQRHLEGEQPIVEVTNSGQQISTPYNIGSNNPASDIEWVVDSHPVKPQVSSVVVDRSLKSHVDRGTERDGLRASDPSILEPSMTGHSVSSRPIVEDRIGKPIQKRAGAVADQQQHLAALAAEDGTPRSGKNYDVQPGDTLYSIAWQFGVSQQMIAVVNNIAQPFVIYPGQRIVVPNVAHANQSARLLYRDTAGSRKSALLETGYKNSEKDKKRVQEKGGKEALKAVNLYWVWPVEGEIVRYFNPTTGTLSKGVNTKESSASDRRLGDSNQVSKGLDIMVEAGSSVFAAADGKVVYSGQGLVGYGKLIIIKHHNDLLSAYGHNKTLLVSEGEQVKAGDRIATIGSVRANQNILHFEIRQAGQPVDPLSYLPKRTSS